MSNHAKTRFIAGAVCPNCHQLDTTVINRSVEPASRECVDCGFKQVQGQKKQVVTEAPVKWVKRDKK